ncbi:MAG: hypothetical protein ACRD2Z_16920 [Thermoanaerobaculia bacterium]
MTRLHCAGTLGTLLVLAASCVSIQAPSGRGAVFMSVPLSATTLEIEYYAGGLPAYQRAFAALCRCAELALDRGFRYLRIYDRERLGPGEARWKLQLVHALPEGAVLLDVAEPTWEGDPPAEGVLDAVSFAAACGERSTSPDSHATR